MAKVVNPLYSIQASGKLGPLIYALCGYVQSRKIVKRWQYSKGSPLQKKYRKRFRMIYQLKRAFLKTDYTKEDLTIPKVDSSGE